MDVLLNYQKAIQYDLMSTGLSDYLVYLLIFVVPMLLGVVLHYTKKIIAKIKSFKDNYD